MISQGVGIGATYFKPSGHKVRVVDVYTSRYHSTPRVRVVLTNDPQPSPFIHGTYSVETVRRWKPA